MNNDMILDNKENLLILKPMIKKELFTNIRVLLKTILPILL